MSRHIQMCPDAWKHSPLIFLSSVRSIFKAQNETDENVETGLRPGRLDVPNKFLILRPSRLLKTAILTLAIDSDR
jgi:hypothetical protein